MRAVLKLRSWPLVLCFLVACRFPLSHCANRRGPTPKKWADTLIEMVGNYEF